jgi:hypothetical protein
VRAAQKLLGVPTIGGGVLGQGVVVEGVKGVKYASMPAEIYKNFFAYKLLKNAIIRSKVYIFPTFF